VIRIADSIRGTLRSAKDAERERKIRELAKSQRVSWAQGIDVLYKLRSLAPGSRDHTLDIIANSRVYFPSPLQFNDPFDCFPPFLLGGDVNDPEFVKELARDEARMIAESGIGAEEVAALRVSQGVPIEKMADAVRENTVKAIRDDTRVLCLATEQRHPLMWSHYASSHSGICLHFRCGPDNLFGLARQVLYVEERKAVLIPLKQSGDEITDRLVFEKAKFWDYESEYRVIGHTDTTVDWGETFDESGRVAFPPESLCGITLGMRISDPDRATITAMAAAHKPAIPVWQATESHGRFWIDVQRVA
jgi:hypothetical protein